MIPETAQMCRTSWKAGRGHFHARGTSELTQGGRSRPAGKEIQESDSLPPQKQPVNAVLLRACYL